MSVAAHSHTQRTSSTPFLRSISTLRVFEVGEQRKHSSVRVEKPETEVALVCRGGMAAMDMTDEADPTVKGQTRMLKGTSQRVRV